MKTRWIAPMVALAVLALAGHARAQIKYVDEKGVAHWVQRLDQVPEEYREKASKQSLNALPNANVAPQKSTVKGDSASNSARNSELDARIRAADEALAPYKRAELEQLQAEQAQQQRQQVKWRMVGRLADRDSGRPVAAAADMNLGTYYDVYDCQAAITRRLRMEADRARGGYSYTAYTCERE